MTATAGFSGKLYLKATSGSVTESDFFATLDDQSWNASTNQLDVTTYGTAGHEATIGGLMSSGLSISGNYDADSTVQLLVEQAFFSRGLLYYTYQPTGSATRAYTGRVRVESFDVGGAVGDKATFSASLKGTDVAPTPITS